MGEYVSGMPADQALQRLRDGNAAFVVYINAQSGAEEQLFEIINSDEGEFTV